MRRILFAAAFAVCSAGNLAAAPITIGFTGVQWSEPVLIRGALNFLNVSEMQTVHGSFTVDLDGQIDLDPNPLSARYEARNTGPIENFSFESV